MAGGWVCWVIGRGLLHACRDVAAALSGEAVERAERLSVRRGHKPHAGLVPRRDAKAVFGKRGPKGGRAVAGLPCRADGHARVREGHAIPFGPRPLTARHGSAWWLGRGLAPDKGGNVRAAGALKFGRDRSRPAAGYQVVTEIVFQRPRDGFQPNVGTAIVQCSAVWPDMGDYEMEMRIDVAASAVLPGVLPHDMRVVFRAQRG